MIKIVRIAGESFDLETQQEMPKALILSNGERELSLYVDDDVAKEIIEMMKETAKPAQMRQAGYAVPPGPQRLGNVEAPCRPLPTAKPQTDFEPGNPDPIVSVPPMATIEVGGAALEPGDNAEIEPGEEYNDPATGAASL